METISGISEESLSVTSLNSVVNQSATPPANNNSYPELSPIYQHHHQQQHHHHNNMQTISSASPQTMSSSPSEYNSSGPLHSRNRGGKEEDDVDDDDDDDGGDENDDDDDDDDNDDEDGDKITNDHEMGGQNMPHNENNNIVTNPSAAKDHQQQLQHRHDSSESRSPQSDDGGGGDGVGVVVRRRRPPPVVTVAQLNVPVNPNAFRSISNGTLPKSGKPMMSSLNKKLNKPRGRPKRKEQLPLYQSQISENKIGIKLCIKKSSDSHSVATIPKTTVKPSRKRSRRPKTKPPTDSEDSDYERRKRRTESLRTRSNNNTDKNKTAVDDGGPSEQGVWGESIPQEILYNIFKRVVDDDGSLPSIVRLGRVCRLWNKVSITPSLWRNLDLSIWTKDKHRTELKLKWLIENRLRDCTELNLANWKITNILCVLERLAESSPNLKVLSLSGWKGLSPDHLNYLVEQLGELKRIDLSSVNVEMNTSKSAVGLIPLCNAMQVMHERLTHLNLAHNRLAGIPQIINTLAAHCPNLLSLDLSNVSTIATSHGILHIEKLQHGCPKLKVLLITNSHITLSTATLQEQMDSLGFPDLEELSVASLADESRLINDEYIQRILKTSKNLKLLDVRGCARLTHDSLIRLPAWDLKHLFLSGCSITRDVGCGLELIASKWAHSLTEIDLAWANVQTPLDNCLKALAEKGSESPLSHINLCGSSVSLEAVKEVLKKCPSISSINLSSCRGLPRGVKRLLQGSTEITELKENLGVIEKQPKPSPVVAAAAASPANVTPSVTATPTGATMVQISQQQEMQSPSSNISSPSSAILSPLSLQSPQSHHYNEPADNLNLIKNEMKLEVT